ncbi:hypothetical protein SAMN05216226_10336 [Halovenus aranensis]|uniref:Glycoside hydrolase domain protein n=1 Tax=Halovenus aranensis TaxID=890420 RepID=A0A1G8TH14_9EURY|nr:hypothetical protein [Halovenus aranensis]SDJ40205.1 hypothetical protein SAMN05216226_10336 [Halovenus aranensis]
MYGVVTRNEEEVSWEEFERVFFEMKDVTGRATTPVAGAVNMISCFGDNAAVEGDPSLAPVSAEGERATRDRDYFDWDYVCPTDDTYREGVLEMIDDAVEADENVRLDDVGFPREEYCHCDRCERRFEASEFEDRTRWRQQVITDFVAEARERIPGDLYLTLYPDPYPGHLARRSGIDLDALSEYVDEFVVPIYDMAYETTYWVEVIATGFEDRLDTPFSIELYAINIDLDNLVHATEVAQEYAKSVLFGYQAGNGRAAIRRMHAEQQDGVDFGPE